MEKCNCGRGLKYYHSEGRMSCNKHLVCPTWDELYTTLQETQRNYWELIKAANDLLVFREGTKQYLEAEAKISKLSYKDV